LVLFGSRRILGGVKMKNNIYSIIVAGIILTLLVIVFFAFRFLYLAQKKATVPDQAAVQSSLIKFDMEKYNEIKEMFVELK
jgi:hypothetical protein